MRFIMINLPKTMFLVVWHCGDKCVIYIKNPGIFAITFLVAAAAKVKDNLFDDAINVSTVLRRCHVLPDVVLTFFRDKLKAPDVVELNIEPPTLTVGLQASSSQVLSEPLVQDVPICCC